MFNWIKRVFSGTGPLLVAAAVAVARQKLEASIVHTDRLEEVHKAIVRELFEQFVADLLAEINK
jgi:uncharacterized protein (UPF0335 family)